MAQENRFSGDAASRLMQQALTAEKQAEEAVRGCEQQAEAIREQGREDARRIGERTERRINWVHDHCSRTLDQRLAELDTQAEAEKSAGPAWADSELLDRAVARLARRLTSGSGDAG